MWNMVKVNNKNTRMTYSANHLTVWFKTDVVLVYLLILWTYFTSFSDVSIFDFEKVCWVISIGLVCTCDLSNYAYCEIRKEKKCLPSNLQSISSFTNADIWVLNLYFWLTFIWGYPVSKYVKFSKKLTFLTSQWADVCVPIRAGADLVL